MKNILPIPDSESSRGSRLAVDWARCDGHGLCAHIVPELIRLDGNGYPRFSDSPIPAWLESGAHHAVAMCPALALRLAEGDKRDRRTDVRRAGRAKEPKHATRR